MTLEALKGLLTQLIHDWENEVVEFKRAGAGFSTGEIGEYFSALANEANLRHCAHGWLVFGVDNKTHKVVGTDYDVSSEALNRSGGLKFQITQRTDPGVCFNAVHMLDLPEGRVALFEIPAAPQGVPIAWNGHYYARSGESLVALGLDKLEAIRRQGLESDWSAVVVEEATLDDLDVQALAEARRGFITKHSREFTSDEVNGWSMTAFLDKAQLTRNGRITRAALLLVGKAESAHLLSPHPAQLVWKLVGEENANDVFYPPFLLTTTKLNSRIRNVQIRIHAEGRLVPDEVPKYKDESILEALHNCIAHQDYRLNGRVVVTEYVDRLTFFNLGGFYEGRPEEYMNGDKMPTRYRNVQLVKAMREINMIDTMGYGLSIPSAAIAHLRRAGLIEGRKPHWYVSAKIAAQTGREAEYMRKMERSSGQYQRIIIDILQKFPGISRKKINELMLVEIRGELTDSEKLSKISNLLTVLRRKGRIVNKGTDRNPCWHYID